MFDSIPAPYVERLNSYFRERSTFIPKSEWKAECYGSKTFVCNEMFDGKMVNVVDGLKLYEELFDEKEVSNLVSLVGSILCHVIERTASPAITHFTRIPNNLREAGQTYVASKKPVKGHGREMIQLGLPIADAPLDVETAAGKRRVEAIPSLLQDVIERLATLQVITSKPDSCIIDVYNEGDHSPPRTIPPWYGKPVCIMFLTECDITVGRVIAFDHPGVFRGSLKLSLAPGSILMMQGKSADFTKHALPSVRKQRILITFTKYQPKKLMTDNQRLPSPSVSQPSKWSPPPSRSPNHFRPSAGAKPYTAIPPTVVFLAAPNRPQIPPPNVVQPLFVPGSVPPAIPFHAPVPIPPVQLGSSNSSLLELTTATELNVPADSTFQPEKENCIGKANLHTTLTNGRLDEKSPKQDCKGSVEGTGNGVAVKEAQQGADNNVEQTC
ncbi:Hydroxyproline-rich glycoprotein family protein, putative isoform 5 [Hibiscus syriacus]|uniref:Hydroxyproline-rich glycoprotein family protein, putative isoform 5 n=1 Tax=Hibiscus syriacus TaxID=106335 RepID=A0A6A3BUY7_HIBSY|nr:Hydroxyproline-rich glycoprotein family protein, putative isoform 5 [Hibiscus syriacus]